MFEAASPLAAQTISPKVSHRRAILIGLIVVGALVTLGLLLLWWHPWALVRKGEIRSGDSVERAILKKSS
jgi:amino acid transporter